MKPIKQKRQPASHARGNPKPSLSAAPDWKRIARLFGSVIVFGILLAVFILGGFSPNKKLSDREKAMLAQYEQIRIAFVQEDLAAAQKAALVLRDSSQEPEIAEGVNALEKSTSLDEARHAFTTISRVAVRTARGNSSYYVMACPPDCPRSSFGEWVQSYAVIENPFMGIKGIHCGYINRNLRAETTSPTTK